MNTNISTQVKQFNEILSSFLIQLSPIIGTTYSYQLDKIIKCNSTLPIEQYCCYILPLKDKVINKDEAYFNNTENYKDEEGRDISDMNTLEELFKLRNIFNKLNDESKANVWDIIHALLHLSEEYIIIKYKK